MPHLRIAVMLQLSRQCVTSIGISTEIKGTQWELRNSPTGISQENFSTKALVQFLENGKILSMKHVDIYMESF